MRTFNLVIGLMSVLLVGCQPQQTNIVRRAKLPDGTELSYSNTSSGYFFNPNYTNDPGLGGPAIPVGPSWVAGPGPCGIGYSMPCGGPFPAAFGTGCGAVPIVVPDYGGSVR